LVHGKDTTYQKGCRCDKCTLAHREYHRNYKRRKAGLPPTHYVPVGMVKTTLDELKERWRKEHAKTGR